VFTVYTVKKSQKGGVPEAVPPRNRAGPTLTGLAVRHRNGAGGGAGDTVTALQTVAHRSASYSVSAAGSWLTTSGNASVPVAMRSAMQCSVCVCAVCRQYERVSGTVLW
jgi:hypothetical protein